MPSEAVSLALWERPAWLGYYVEDNPTPYTFRHSNLKAVEIVPIRKVDMLPAPEIAAYSNSQKAGLAQVIDCPTTQTGSSSTLSLQDSSHK